MLPTALDRPILLFDYGDPAADDVEAPWERVPGDFNSFYIPDPIISPIDTYILGDRAFLTLEAVADYRDECLRQYGLLPKQPTQRRSIWQRLFGWFPLRVSFHRE